MSFYLKLALATLSISGTAMAQHTINAKIVDQNHQPIPFANVALNNQEIEVNSDGLFTISDLKSGSYTLFIHEQGYIAIEQSIALSKSTTLTFVLIKDETYQLQEIKVIGHTHGFSTANSEKVDQQYVVDHYAGSLAKSLENLAGVNASGIGSSASKPIIRGLGFNRLSVTENGLKQEGQQWGADHGLEIDALNVEEIEVIKGPGTLEYGNEAIAGVIKIKNDRLPAKNSSNSSVQTLYQSVNDHYGIAFQHATRGTNSFIKVKGSYGNYGDYRTTTDRIKYLDRYLPIYDKRVKNTAGRDINAQIQLGYVTDHFRTTTTLSNVAQKTGFFPGSHGIPVTERLKPDGNNRNIEYPYQQVNHFKVINDNQWTLNSKNALNLLMGYQYNVRQEKSEFHTHYQNEPLPLKNADLELGFKLSTYDAQLKFEHNHNRQFKTVAGIQTQIQRNEIEGYNYLLPRYERNIYSAYVLEEFKRDNRWKITAGIRYDYAKVATTGYFDQFLYDYLIHDGLSPTTANHYANRSASIDRNFGNINGMIGATYRPNDYWDFTLNAGTNFRLPTAIELASNGIHHGSFRHERGNADLDTEKGYAIDFKTTYHQNGWEVSVSPYMYYFTNYLFLKPSGQFSILPHGGQIYDYTQSKALLTGFEVSIAKTFADRLSTQAIYEFNYNRQLNDNNHLSYFLPFTPPHSLFAEVTYQVTPSTKKQAVSVYTNARYAFEQSNIAQNEDITAGYFIMGLGARAQLHVGNFKFNTAVQVSNLLNEKYYNHTSFYRVLEMPEQARNIQVILSIPF